MTIQQAIESAIKGGYDKGSLNFLPGLPDYAQSQIWLDPNFWKALGRSERWNCNCDKKLCMVPTPQDRCHMMIDALWAGKSVEEYLSEL